MTDNETRDETDLDDIVRDAHRFYREAKSHSSEWRNQAPKWYDLVANKQWDEDDITTMEDQKRIPVVINRTARAINAIIGTQVANRQETRFIPRNLGNVQVNEVLSGAAEWVRDGCDAEDEESDAFEDTTTCGMGWTETFLDYETDLDGSIIIDRRDPMEMYWDPAARKRNLADGKRVGRMVPMPRDEFDARWPKADANTSAGPWNDESSPSNSRVFVYPQDAYKNQQSLGTTQKSAFVNVFQYQYAHREPVYRVGPQAEKLTQKQFEKIKDKIEAAKMPFLKQQGVTWRQAFIAGSALLEDDECPFPDGPTLRCITYKRDRNKNTWYGIVAAMMDPQKYGNKFLSLIMDIVTKQSKGGVIMEKDAVDDTAEVEKKWATPDGIVFVRSGAIGKIKDKPQMNLPPGLDRLVAYFLDSVHEVTGINLEQLGMANRDQPGVLEHQRKQAGLTIIAPLFDGLRRYRKEQGRVLLHFIQTYISDGRLIRIVGQDGEQFVQLAKQSDTAKFDVIVDEAPTSPNMKERVFGALTEMLPNLAKMGIPLPPELLDYAPIPSSLASKWKALIQQSQGANPQQLQQQMGEMQKQIAQLTDQNKQLQDKRDLMEQEMQMQGQKMANDIQLEREKAAAELQLEREKAFAQIELEREKAGANLDLQSQKMGQEHTLAQTKAQNDFTLKQDANANDAVASAGNMEIRTPDGRIIKIKRDAKGVPSDVQVEGSKPRKRSVTFKRDAQGELVGADVMDGD
jgi:hypothetical protein